MRTGCKLAGTETRDGYPMKTCLWSLFGWSGLRALSLTSLLAAPTSLDPNAGRVASFQGGVDAPGDPVRQAPQSEHGIRCLNVTEGRNAIVDESVEPYFSQLQRREIAALTGKEATAETLEGCRQQARQRFQNAALSFTAEEEEALTWFADRLRRMLVRDYPLFANQPWRFIKTRDDLCGGFSRTRGPCILFSQRTVRRIVKARDEKEEGAALRKVGPLLVHEQMHVLERFHPGKFAGLFTNLFGLTRGQILPNDWLTERQMSNPDGIRLEWFVALPDDPEAPSQPRRYFWPCTILRQTEGIPRMGRDFLEIAVRVAQVGPAGRFQVMTKDGRPVFQSVQSLTEFARRFPDGQGLDHPNEMAAYLFAKILDQDFLAQLDGERGRKAEADQPAKKLETPKSAPTRALDPAERLFSAFRSWCLQNLK
jgi:hypothetical protein